MSKKEVPAPVMGSPKSSYASFLHIRTVREGVEEYHHLWPGGMRTYHIPEVEARGTAEFIGAEVVRFKNCAHEELRARNSDEPIKV